MAKKVTASKEKTFDLIVGDKDIFETFLRRGYLPEVLPPIVTSNPWADELGSPVALAIPTFELNRIPYSCTKRGYGRRYFDIIHPLSAIANAAWLSTHWKEVETFCNHQDTAPISLEIQTDEEARALSTCSFDRVLHTAKHRLSKARYIVRSDIAKYYPSIYTHVLPWALHGKEQSKVDRNWLSANIFGNGLDWAIRLGQGNQTKGVPIGPDFSRVAGEIVGNAIDRIVLAKTGTKHSGYLRNIDDFYIGADDLGAAEAILHALQEAVREYELELNDDKTFIDEARKLTDESWIHEIDLIIGDGRTGSDFYRRLDRAFDRAFHFASSSSADSSLKYLVRMVDRHLSEDRLDFTKLEHNIIRALINFPHCMDYCILVFLKQNLAGNANRALWMEVLTRELRRHFSVAHDHEVAWILTAAIGAKINLGSFNLPSDSNRQLTNTLFCACLDEGLINFDINALLSQLLPDSAVNANWLLCNEILTRDWSTAATKKRIKSNLDSSLKHSVSFLDSDFTEGLKDEMFAIPDRYQRYDDEESDEDLSFLSDAIKF